MLDLEGLLHLACTVRVSVWARVRVRARVWARFRVRARVRVGCI